MSLDFEAIPYSVEEFCLSINLVLVLYSRAMNS